MNPPTTTEAAALDLRAIAARERLMLEVLQVDGAQFAEKIGVPYSTMRSYIAGGRAPSPEFLAGCYRAYAVMPSWLSRCRKLPIETCPLTCLSNK